MIGQLGSSDVNFVSSKAAKDEPPEIVKGNEKSVIKSVAFVITTEAEQVT
jgi:hypothetical protein